MPLRSQGIDGGRIATTLLVGVPRAVAGFDSPRIIYVRDADQRHVYTDSAWIDTPARMISPLIVARIADSGLFRGVVAAPSSMAADVRLDTEIVSLQQEFTVIPSRVRIHVRAYLAVESTRRLLAWTNLEATVPARSEDAIGAVKAAQEAVRIVIADLEDFCLHALAESTPKD
jgi:cholesterol transport system auxiliary component